MDISSQVRQANNSIAALTDRIRKSLNGVDLAYFDIQERMDRVKKLSKVEGQTELNKLSDFLNKKIDDIAGDIKEASISSLRANKERLENLHGIAKDTLDGSKQGMGVYAQYQILVKKLDEEIKTRKKVVFRMEDFLKKNGIDTISVVSALTTRNPLVGLGIKYVLERRKAAKEKEAYEKSLDTKDSIAYRDLLIKQRDSISESESDSDEDRVPRKGKKKRKKKVVAAKVEEPEETEEVQTPKARRAKKAKPVHHKKTTPKVVDPNIIDAEFEDITDSPKKEFHSDHQAKWRANYKARREAQEQQVKLPKLLEAGAIPMPAVAPKELPPSAYAMPEIRYPGAPQVALPEASGTRLHNQSDFNSDQMKFIHDLINESGGNTIFDRKYLEQKNKEMRGKAAAPDFIVKNLNAKTPQKGKYDLGNLLPQNQALVPTNDRDRDSFLHAISALNLSTIHVYKDLEKYHKEDHLFDERKAEDAEQAHIEKLAQDEKMLEALRGIGSNESGSGLKALIHQPKEHKNHPILDEIIGRALGNKLTKFIPGIGLAKKGGGLLRRFIPGLSKTAAGAEAGIGAGEAAAGVAEGAGAATAKGAGSILGKLTGPILGFAIDSVLGIFKSDDWKTSKTSAGLGGLLGGTFNNKIINVFAQMGKYAGLGAAMGAPVGGFGAIPGGIIGAAIGAVMGVIGGENIANFAEKTGIGRYISSFFGMLGNLILAPVKHVWDALKDVGSALKFVYKATTSIFSLLLKPVSDLFNKTVEPVINAVDPLLKGIADGMKRYLGFFSDIFDWVSNLTKKNDENMDKAKADGGKMFEDLLTGFQKALLDMLASMLESIPAWVPGSSAMKTLAKGYRKESAGIATKTTTPTLVNPSATTAPPVTKPEGTKEAPKGPEVRPPQQSDKMNGDVNDMPAVAKPAPSAVPSPGKNSTNSPATTPNVTPSTPKPVLGTSVGSTNSTISNAIAHSIAKHEGFGRPGVIPTITNNPGDIIAGKFATAHGATGVKTSKDGKYNFAVFPDVETGFKAEAALIDNYIAKGYSLEGLINRLNPPNAPGNTPAMTQKYLMSVARETNIDPKIPLKDLQTSFLAKNNKAVPGQPATPPAMVMGSAQNKPATITPKTSEVSSAPAAVPTASLSIQNPKQGQQLMSMIKDNEDQKAQDDSKSSAAGPTLVAPSQTNVNNTAIIAQQTNPRNTDSTMRDTRFRTGYNT
jgi:hypothetical protein